MAKDKGDSEFVDLDADNDQKKGVPPITPKSKGVEHLDRGGRAQNTGGDLMDRYRQQYAKNPPPSDDPFGSF